MSPAPPPLIAHLAARLSEGQASARIIETHISWVILTPEYAYKLKKPVNLGFLDFSTLERRQHFCLEEIRLNRRLAPEIYLEALPVTGTVDQPRLNGDGPILEWAVKMRAFHSPNTLDLEPRLQAEQVDAIADRIARFHQSIDAAPAESDWGTPEHAQAPILQNFSQLRALGPPTDVLGSLDALEAWARREGQRLAPFFAQRKARGFIRECHGDLHLGNIVWEREAPLLFDGIEFNPGLRFIDVMSEMAFLAMDLSHRGRGDLAWRALNRYLEHTGDYGGLPALPYYMVYRAMVRAKVAGIRARQEGDECKNGGDFREARAYLALAQGFTRPAAPALILMHGVSGSGKTVLSQHLLEDLPAIRLRSDVERKRLFGLTPWQDSSAIPGGIYTREAGLRTRQQLLDTAQTLLAEGFRVIVDATFIARDWRQAFMDLARTACVPWCLVSPQVPEAALRARVAQRAAVGRDASEAGAEVLAAQLASQEVLDDQELARAVRPEAGWPRDQLLAATLSILHASSAPTP